MKHVVENQALEFVLLSHLAAYKLSFYCVDLCSRNWILGFIWGLCEVGFAWKLGFLFWVSVFYCASSSAVLKFVFCVFSDEGVTCTDLMVKWLEEVFDFMIWSKIQYLKKGDEEIVSEYRVINLYRLRDEFGTAWIDWGGFRRFGLTLDLCAGAVRITGDNVFLE